jgi:hypothetical protein
MPSWVKTEKDEELWSKAKKIVKKEYNLSEDDGENFWKLVTGVYKRSGGTIVKETLDNRDKVLKSLFESKSKYGFKEGVDFSMAVRKIVHSLYPDRYYEASFTSYKSMNTGRYVFRYKSVNTKDMYDLEVIRGARTVVDIMIEGFNAKAKFIKNTSFRAFLMVTSNIPTGASNFKDIESDSIDDIYDAITKYFRVNRKYFFPLSEGHKILTKGALGKIKY